MLRLSLPRYRLIRARRASPPIQPSEVFRTLQLGAYPSPQATKRFMEANFHEELLQRGISPLKLAAMEANSANVLMRNLFQSKFLSVPCRIITFDLEFTQTPTFTKNGPTEEITEIGAYCPIRGKVFSRLVKPETRKITAEVVKLTGITNELVESEGLPFNEAWEEFVKFIEDDDWVPPATVPQIPSGMAENAEAKKRENSKGWTPSNGHVKGDNSKKAPPPPLTLKEINQAGERCVKYDPLDIRRIPLTLEKMGAGKTSHMSPRVLLLSHGGRLADIPMIEWNLKKYNLMMPENYKFGDTHNIILDLHHKRPVTQDKHPPSMNLSELCAWMKSPVPKNIHRAGPDAAMTWSVLFHSMDRYGDESRTPHDQLVLRFFEKETIDRMNDFGAEKSARIEATAGDEPREDDMSVLDLDLDSILK